MIKGFRCADTRALFETGKSKRFANVANVATRKLAQLDAAHTLEFLRSPPGNRMEALRGDRAGRYSIRINDQFRLCFRWTSVGPTDVEIVDYH
jgi:proteic killer suppression protein